MKREMSHFAILHSHVTNHTTIEKEKSDEKIKSHHTTPQLYTNRLNTDGVSCGWVQGLKKCTMEKMGGESLHTTHTVVLRSRAK